MNVVELLIEADRQEPKRILVVGDCMLDTYVYGKLYPHCQEGCPKFVKESHVVVPGGAANAARSLKQWNCQVECLPGISPLVPEKVRFMVDDQCIFRYDDDYCGLMPDAVQEHAMHHLKTQPVDAVLMSDYDKGMLSLWFLRSVAEHCASAGIPCVADCKRHPSVYCPDLGVILKGNNEYFKQYAERARTRESRAVTTYGGTQPLVWDRGDCWTAWQIGVVPSSVKCVNHVGAGDCFAAHMTLALAHKFSLKDAVGIAHSAGRVYVQHRHNRPPLPQEVAADFVSG